MDNLEQLAQEPSQAAAIASRLMAEYSGHAEEIGTIVIGALVRASAYGPALELAQSGPEAGRTGWITLVLIHWTKNHPEDAEFITSQLREKGVTAEAFSLVTKSWATAAPAQLARYALSLPPGEHRSIALDTVLDPWIQQDPAAVATWMPQLANPFERDQALSHLVARTDNAFRPTSQALAWAESIENPELRRTALASIVREWSGQDSAAATHYIETSSTFNQDQRHQLITSLTPRVDPP
jgi:hypothetical protein